MHSKGTFANYIDLYFFSNKPLMNHQPTMSWAIFPIEHLIFEFLSTPGVLGVISSPVEIFPYSEAVTVFLLKQASA